MTPILVYGAEERANQRQEPAASGVTLPSIDVARRATELPLVVPPEVVAPEPAGGEAEQVAESDSSSEDSGTEDFGPGDDPPPPASEDESGSDEPVAVADTEPSGQADDDAGLAESSPVEEEDTSEASAVVAAVVLTADQDVVVPATGAESSETESSETENSATETSGTATTAETETTAVPDTAVEPEEADEETGPPPAEAPQDADELPAGDTEDALALPRARNIDLTEPVSEEFEPEVEVLVDNGPELVESGLGEDLVLLGARVEPGTSTRLSWSPQDTFEGIAVPTPVLVVNGVKPGPVLCLTGAVHGDEINGIEVIRRVMYDLNPADISGAVIGVPIVNQVGFRRNSRYLSDRRDLNRYFPGTPDGSSAARIAYSFFQEVVVNCDMLVDIHTGSFHRTNLPQLRADLKNPAVAEFARAFGDMVVLHGEGQHGTLRREAVEIGIPAVTVEAGEPMRIQEESVADGVKGIRTLMTSLGMSSRSFFWSRPRPAYYRSYWVRASRGGVLMSSVELGAQVREGDVLGVVVNPITNQKSDIVSPFAGKVIGMALNQVVMPGFAAYHVGIQASEEEMRTLYGDKVEVSLDDVYRGDRPYPPEPETPGSREE